MGKLEGLKGFGIGILASLLSLSPVLETASLYASAYTAQMAPLVAYAESAAAAEEESTRTQPSTQPSEEPNTQPAEASPNEEPNTTQPTEAEDAIPQATPTEAPHPLQITPPFVLLQIARLQQPILLLLLTPPTAPILTMQIFCQ
ncbi:hypothetical protein KPC83_06905 [Collinsella sp. zg1085]|uniref:hypothetical protein n=1 Tax=Collinsella sp. zg1085 TaxID=2844380 RepID=UPI001C0B9178|nr:hypothetical protein [Collinsella sp. zg1085]QWT17553.1 hypothetical protein KPC83_06905 [Collinsella sp. zg1085]